MRHAFAVVLVAPLLLGAFVGPTCPPDCFSGGGPAVTDCFVQFAGITASAVTCTDGDVGCDADGRTDGVCTFGVAACINAPGDGCASAGLDGAATVKPTKDAAARAFAAALGALDPGAQGCTTGGYALPVKGTLKGLRPGKAKLTVTAVSGGRKDVDRLKLTCNPGTAVPSLANDVQPILTAKCAIPSCHVGIPGSGDLNLEAGNTIQAVGKVSASVLAKGLLVIAPGSIGKSYFARKILDLGLAKFDGAMPQGCPGVTPCLTASELGTVLQWIRGGAPAN